jgi:hypothetical protein
MACSVRNSAFRSLGNDPKPIQTIAQAKMRLQFEVVTIPRSLGSPTRVDMLTINCADFLSLISNATKQANGSGTKEDARKLKQRLRAGILFSRGISRSQHHPISVQFDLIPHLSDQNPCTQ